MTLLKIADVCKITNFSKSHIYKLIRSGLFPKQLIIGNRSVRWLSSDVEDWIKQQNFQQGDKMEI